MSGKIIFLHGASSSGKSTLARYLQKRLPEPFWHYSIDHLLDAEILPRHESDEPQFQWKAMRENFFEGFHRSIEAFARANNNLVVEHIVETETWKRRLLETMKGLDVYSVCIRCPVSVLEEREKARGDRRIGSAVEDSFLLDKYWEHDIEVNSTDLLESYGEEVLGAWKKRKQPTAFHGMVRT